MFKAGEHVRTREQRNGGHTRLPHYLQQRSGRVVRILGTFRFADDAAERGTAAADQMLYTVEFEHDGHRVCADLFESYLERES